jgi:hypothetical protein
MHYTLDNLPDHLLKPPVKATHNQQEATWARNWTIYHIYMNWDGSQRGLLNVLARWINTIDHRERLTRQRIDMILTRMHWALPQYQVLNLDAPVKIEKRT